MHFVRSFLVNLFAFFLIGTFTTVLADEPRPNIILIMADDMGFSDLGCYGSEIQTPHLDKLANQGTRWTQFYNNAKCTTTRASLLTGLTPRRKKNQLLTPNMVTLGEVMQLAGYRTCLSGKWHLGHQAPHRPSDRGFDHYYGLLDGCCNFFDPSIPDPPFKGSRVRHFSSDNKPITNFPKDFYTTTAFTEDAIQFITQENEKEKPFFLHLCYTAPHYPLHAPESIVSKYLGKYQAGWDVIRKQRYHKQLELGLLNQPWELPKPNREVKEWNGVSAPNWQDRRMAVYAAMVEVMDREIGRLLQTVADNQLTENTVVMFLSDNGGSAETPGGEDPTQKPGIKETYTTCGPGWAYASNTPFRRYKKWLHEGGISTPLIVHWPKIIEGGTINRNVGHIIDILPTCLEIAGTKYPKQYNGHRIEPVEGVSLLSAMKSGEQDESLKERTFYWEWNGSRAIRIGDSKLCWDRDIKEWELYDISQDRTELNNLAKTDPSRVNLMSQKWMTWAKKTNVKFRK